jgi:hypothetical protein
MFGKNSQLTTLEVRKQLLIAESEVNRAGLLKDVEHLKSEVHHFKKQVAAVGTVASSAALLATAVSFFRRRFMKPQTADGRKKTSWMGTAIDAASAGAFLYSKIKSLFRDRDHDREHEHERD